MYWGRRWESYCELWDDTMSVFFCDKRQFRKVNKRSAQPGESISHSSSVSQEKNHKTAITSSTGVPKQSFNIYIIKPTGVMYGIVRREKYNHILWCLYSTHYYTVSCIVGYKIKYKLKDKDKADLLYWIIQKAVSLKWVTLEKDETKYNTYGFSFLKYIRKVVVCVGLG